MGGGGSKSHASVLASLTSTPLALYFSDLDLQAFSAMLHPHSLKAGSAVELKKDYLYIVARGQVNMHASGDRAGDIFLCSKRAGDFVSISHTIEQASSSAVSAAVVRATTTEASELLAISDADLNGFLETHPQHRRTLAFIREVQVEDILEKIKFLQKIPKHELAVLASMTRYEAFRAEETVFKEGADGDKLYILIQGSIDITTSRQAEVESIESNKTIRHLTMKADPAAAPLALAPAADKKADANDGTGGANGNANGDAGPGRGVPRGSIVLATLGESEYFGETALMFGIPRTTTVTARERSMCITINKPDFLNFMKLCPSVENELKTETESRLRSKLVAMDLPLLHGFNFDYAKLVEKAEMSIMQANDIVFREGEKGDAFFIIVHGGVQVVGDDIDTDTAVDVELSSKRVKKVELAHQAKRTSKSIYLGPGKYFGEMALLEEGGVLRSRTVKVSTSSILLKFDREAFLNIFGRTPEALAEFKLRIMGNSATLLDVLTHPIGHSNFKAYLEAEMAGESLAFWDGCVAAGKLDDAEAEDAHLRALYDTYAKAGAEHAVNISGKVRTKLADAVAEGKLSSDLFHEAKTQILKLMMRDNFSRFKKSKHFDAFMRAIGLVEYGRAQSPRSS